VQNVVQVNLLAALAQDEAALNEVYNVAVNRRTTLKELFVLLRDRLAVDDERLRLVEPVHREFRKGDVLHSQADISKAERLLGYRPTHTIEQGLDEALSWYRKNAGTPAKVQA
jgi:UDP-N-acetylglucosamine/UDP-N-acetyl-alpha-D-glucosaminouronate 4-epimerase